MAFHTAPLVSATTMDAKVTTADMASRMMVWAEFGRSNQTERLPSTNDQNEFPANDGLYPSGYRLISARQAPAPKAAATVTKTWTADPPHQHYGDRLWKGWVLPASDADIWFVSGSAAYYDDLDSKDLAKAMAAHWAQYRSLSLSAPNAKQQFELETQKGVLFLDQLRRNMGDDRFFKLMSDFFAAHKAKAVTAQSFLDAAGVNFALPADPGGPEYLVSDLRHRLGSALLVYGTSPKRAPTATRPRKYRSTSTGGWKPLCPSARISNSPRQIFARTMSSSSAVPKPIPLSRLAGQTRSRFVGRPVPHRRPGSRF